MKLVHGTASKKSAGKKKDTRKVHSMHITRAKNGFTVSTHHEQAKSPRGIMNSYQPPEESVFNDHAGLMAHVADKFGAPPPGTPPESAAPAPGQEPS